MRGEGETWRREKRGRYSGRGEKRDGEEGDSESRGEKRGRDSEKREGDTE